MLCLTRPCRILIDVRIRTISYHACRSSSFFPYQNVLLASYPLVDKVTQVPKDGQQVRELVVVASKPYELDARFLERCTNRGGKVSGGYLDDGRDFSLKYVLVVEGTIGHDWLVFDLVGYARSHDW